MLWWGRCIESDALRRRSLTRAEAAYGLGGLPAEGVQLPRAGGHLWLSRQPPFDCSRISRSPYLLALGNGVIRAPAGSGRKSLSLHGYARLNQIQLDKD